MINYGVIGNLRIDLFVWCHSRKKWVLEIPVNPSMDGGLRWSGVWGEIGTIVSNIVEHRPVFLFRKVVVTTC